MLLRGMGAMVLGLIMAGPASAQSFSNTIFFGDSNTDNGRYLYLPQTKGGANFAKAGPYTTNPDPMWSVLIGQHFGINVTPSDAPGGGNNYTAGGARVVYEDPASNVWSATSQIKAYLASTGGRADPNALYTVYIGVNDLKGTTPAGFGSPGNIVSPSPNFSALTTLGQQDANLVIQLAGAGARYILVPNTITSQTPAAGIANGFGYNASVTAARNFYDQTTYNAIAASGVNFIPADINSILNYVLLNPTPFGIIYTSAATPACALPLPNGAGALNCTPANYVSPNADQTHFYADGLLSSTGGGHLSGAMQQVEADYYYSLLVAPSEISFLAEAPVKTRTAVINSITSQIPLSFSTPGAFHGWVSGDVSWLKVNNSYAGFPDDPGTPLATTAGFDYAITRDWLAGVAFSGGTTSQSFSLGGNFRQTEYAISLYSAYRKDAFWLNAIATWGALTDSVNRQVPLGITMQSNQGNTDGTNVSFAAEAGYNFRTAVGTLPSAAGMALKAPPATPIYVVHGPIVGIIAQQVHIGAFAETNSSGAPTNLAFNSQLRNSEVTELGYQASVNLGMWEPYARAVWNHELDGAGRLVTASLLSITAPSFSLPAVLLGTDWGSATIGTRIKFAPNASAFVAFNSQFGQNNVTTYGGQIGLNVAFQPSTVVAKY
jgi:outer membrane lipase/esterase